MWRPWGCLFYFIHENSPRKSWLWIKDKNFLAQLFKPVGRVVGQEHSSVESMDGTWLRKQGSWSSSLYGPTDHDLPSTILYGPTYRSRVRHHLGSVPVNSRRTPEICLPLRAAATALRAASTSAGGPHAATTRRIAWD